MMRLALAMALKDVRLTLFRSAGLVQALLLGLLLVFMFSLSSKKSYNIRIYIPTQITSGTRSRALTWTRLRRATRCARPGRGDGPPHR